MEIQIGQYSLPVVLTAVLMLVYQVSGDSLSNRVKPLIAVAIGIGLGLLAIVREALPWDAAHIIDYTLYGLMSGLAAVGLYEVQRALRRPRQ